MLMNKAEEDCLLAEVERTYEAAKGTWTGRTWDDGDKVTPDSADDQIAGMLTNGEDMKVTCWGIDHSEGNWDSRVRAEIKALRRLWAQSSVCDDSFSVVCDALRELASESDAGVAKQAKLAENAALKAMEYVRAGERQNAYVLAWDAARIERQYGDAPTWGPFAEAVRAWSEHEAE